MTTSRRQLLKSGTALGAGAALGLPACKDKGGGETGLSDTGEPTPVRSEEPEPWDPEGAEDLEAFPTGVQVGDVSPTAALVSVWTELPEVRFVVVVAEEGAWVELGLPDALQIPVDGVVQVELTGLPADAAVSVVATSADDTRRSRPSRFRTALDEDGWRVVVFGATSCLGGNEPWPNLSALAAEQLDFFCLLGDTIYADNWTPAFA